MVPDPSQLRFRVLISPPYWGNTHLWALLVHASEILLDVNTPFYRATCSLRTWILTGNGPFRLSIPILRTGGQRSVFPLFRQVMQTRPNWAFRHWKTISTALRNAPFSEWFFPSLEVLYRQARPCLIPWLWEIFSWTLQQICPEQKAKVQWLTHSPPFSHPWIVEEEPGQWFVDLRRVWIPCPAPRLRPRISFPSYYQLFPPRKDHSLFWDRLSILDPLLMLGSTQTRMFLSRLVPFVLQDLQSSQHQ